MQETDEESLKLNNELSGDIRDNESESKESFITRIFGSNLNLSGLSFRETIQKILESKNDGYFLK